jgi:hypothetical protein
MGKALGDSPKDDFPMPERVVLVPVDLDPSNECVRVVMMAFVKGTEPAVACGSRRQGVPGSPDAPAPTPGPATPPLPGKPQALEPAPLPPTQAAEVTPRARVPAAEPPTPLTLPRDIEAPISAGAARSQGP